MKTKTITTKSTEEKAFDLLESTGLNWSVSKKPLFALPDGGLPTESFGIFREDPRDIIQPQWLGTVGNAYTPMQNRDLAMTIVQASEGVGYEVQKGGLVNDGKRVFLQAKIPSIVIGRGKVERYITALNSHDGSTAIGFGSTSKVMFCANQFNQMYKGLNHFRHTASAKERIDAAIKDMRRALNLDEQLMTNFKRMADLPMTNESIDKLVSRIFNVRMDAKESTIAAPTLARMELFNKSIVTSVEEQGRTVWALFNGLTRYTNHELPQFLRGYDSASSNRKAELRQTSLMTGRGYELSTMGFNEIMKYVEDNTAELVPVTR